MEKRYTYDDLIGIVETLRGENGCPWDKKQTHESLKPCVTEEAAELIAAIRIYDKTGDPENMQEELGDLLLQVVMHAQIAKEEKLFTMEDVVNGISAKMVRRHPHVFGGGERPDAGEVPSGWEEIKKKEKEGKEWMESPLREIPAELPALVRAPKVLQRAESLYGRGNDYYQDVMELEQAVGRLKEHRPGTEEETRETLNEIIGDMLVNLSGIAARFHIPQNQILTDRIEDLIDGCEHRPGLKGR